MQLEFIWCNQCGKVISDDEYVVNWGSCSDCFNTFYLNYCEVNPEQLWVPGVHEVSTWV